MLRSALALHRQFVLEMLPLNVLLATLLLNPALCQRLIIPDSIKSCQPTDIIWDPSVPNTADGPLDVISNFEVSFEANPPGGTSYAIAFTNISSAGFSFIPIFHPGSQITVVQEFNGSSSVIDSKVISVEDSGLEGCLFQFITSPGPSTNSSIPLQFEPTPSMQNTVQCQTANVTWSGGVGPYDLLFTGDLGTSPFAAMAIRNIKGRWVETTFPLWTSSGIYAMVVNDSLNHSRWLLPITVAPPIESIGDCLLHPTDLSTLSNTPPQPSASPAPAPEASASPTPSDSDTNNNQTNTKRRTIIIVVSVVLGVLFCLLLAAFTFRQIKIKGRQRKLRVIQNRFNGRQDDVRLEDLKSPTEPAKM